jgi:hypothetical protein
LLVIVGNSIEGSFSFGGKLLSSLSDNPLFEEALRLTIFSNPFSVKCSLEETSCAAVLNNQKSTCFLEIKG